MTLISDRLNIIKPSPTLAVAKKAAELKASGIDIISLAYGEPDFDTPEFIKQAACEAINAGKTKYTLVDGTISLKKAIQEKFRKENKLDYNLDEITVGTGAKQVIYNALMASINENDEVIIPIPYWVSYPDMVLLAGGKPVYVACKYENQLKLIAEDLESVITPKTKWLILNSPSNPSGATYSFKEMKNLTDILLKYPHVNILADDIYEHLIFDDCEFATPAAVEPRLKSRVLTINGVSKAHAMTGWRIGYAGGPKELIKAMGIIQSQSTSSPSSISQEAATVALSGDQAFIKEWANIYAKRRNLLLDIFSKAKNLECYKPNGAFYLFVKCNKYFGMRDLHGNIITSDNSLAEYLLAEAKVAVVPGIAFGDGDYFRISYATSEDELIRAASQIVEALNKLV